MMRQIYNLIAAPFVRTYCRINFNLIFTSIYTESLHEVNQNLDPNYSQILI